MNGSDLAQPDLARPVLGGPAPSAPDLDGPNSRPSGFRPLDDPAASDRARFRVLPIFGGVEVLDADFRSFAFSPHTHETPMLGVMIEGWKRFRCARRENVVGPGDLSLVNPGEVHTGGVIEGRLRYFGLYPTPALMAAAGLGETADFTTPAASHTPAWRLLAAALAPGQEPFAAEALLVEGLAAVAERHGAAVPSADSPADAPSCRRAVALARDAIEDGLGGPIRLETLARDAGVSPRHLLRSFRAEIGLSPQHYLRQARVRAAAARLRRGQRLAEAAFAAGFADQAHMTRAFKALMGATPGAYRAAFAS